MSFYADKQTLEDLNLLDRYKNNSIARLFNEVVTTGGRKLMEQLFKNPLTDHVLINERSSILQYFSAHPVAFPFSPENFSIVENYLAAAQQKNFIETGTSIVYKKILKVVANSKEVELLQAEVIQTIHLLGIFHDFLQTLPVENNPYCKTRERMMAIFSRPQLQVLLSQRSVKVLSLLQLTRYDYLLKNVLHSAMQELMEAIFQLDVYIAVSQVAAKRGFSYATALSKEQNCLHINGLYHPALENAVGNDLSMSQQSNVIFLTGANMAGKSTLMKSFGINVYLAHMGFPVAASSMTFSVKDGLYTSINVPDNIDLGYSHFYAEVLRVKKVAEEVAAGKDIFVIFDELFKGTNVKDAYDATLSITQAFSETDTCFFMISTHITEVGEALRATTGNFEFVYLPTVMEGNVPRYTYQLTKGITADKQGMVIIENEGILGIIRGRLS
ncbi:MutS-related protein [Chitinophaga arvensicola]|uniref:MutS domain III n=1 Tax=Chitinophaga arvensicola TaxID=29529 RepID=A0A1I0PKB8_9BACT|nr:DNA mismatch repair protein [Chitinophaga arvensicola]SEW14792.1 MutS domain III [Chitinophaga arvensicola]